MSNIIDLSLSELASNIKKQNTKTLISDAGKAIKPAIVTDLKK